MCRSTSGAVIGAKCDPCMAFRKNAADLHSVPVPNEAMRQIGIDLTSKEGYKYLFVAIDYFPKWSEALRLKDKSVPGVAKASFKMICRHKCFQIVFHDQETKFCNHVSNALYKLTGANQGMIIAYHPQIESNEPIAIGLNEKINMVKAVFALFR